MIAALALIMASQSVEAMRHERRVLIVAAPAAQDARRVRQEVLSKAADRALHDRDVSIVAVTGDTVHGASDIAAALRRRWRLAADAFTVVLVGKDGHEALRRTEPLSGDALIAAIDAMPMRRAGLR